MRRRRSRSPCQTGINLECSVDTAEFEPCSGAAHTRAPSSAGRSHLSGARPGRLRSHRSQPRGALVHGRFATGYADHVRTERRPNGRQADVVLFAATGGAASFRCQLDGGAWQACSSPRTLSGLSGGAHTFRAAAVDAAGNEDASPAEAQFTVDATPPETTLTGKPKRRSRDRTPTIAFIADDPGAEFQCRLDARGWNSCGSPRTFRVKPGMHSLAVRATDAFANVDQTPAQTRFKVLAKR